MEEEIDLTGRGLNNARADIEIWRTPQAKADGENSLIVVECKSDNIRISDKDYAQGEAYARALPGSTLQVVPDAGHWPWIDAPEVVDRVIRFVATDLLKIHGGQITDNWHIEDNLTLLQQMGVAKLAS